MMKWVGMLSLIVLTGYTVRYASFVWKKERNMLASIFILLLGVSLTIIPVVIWIFWGYFYLIE
ncbi:hypothetical protein [Petroclostridium sp. X23]|uniref:hypothetical protein n=1 Tax=Petroclostridium sp. X23 TaxID=3045146 RepID=UPI0024AD3886|nr:hypothetical protein [Petroclostridium sp. X23]WHH58589.1 hypothetical protein QKW49_22795 [Petroclostridium sp. X23]